MSRSLLIENARIVDPGSGTAQNGAVLVTNGLVADIALGGPIVADLAAMTGTTIETASRVVSRLRSHGVIATGRGWTSIIDSERLRTVADGTQL